MNRLKNFEKAEELIREVIINDLGDAIWLGHARCSWGYIKDAVRELKKKELKT
jgi:hypothetical protein